VSSDLSLEDDLFNGESLQVEFKREFPETARNLSEVIASFASTTGGRIYLGVDDDGTIVGIGEFSQRLKDELQQRILGTCGSIEPRIRVSVEFVKRDAGTICVVSVPRGNEPIYFVYGVPYLRDLSESRRATATEVKEVHRRFFLSQSMMETEDDEQSDLIELLYQLSDILLISNDPKEHIMHPDLNQMLYDLDTTGAILLELSRSAAAGRLGAEVELREMGNGLTDLVHDRFGLGGQPIDSFANSLAEIAKSARRLENRIMKRIDDVALEDIRTFLSKDIAELRREWGNAAEYYRRGEFLRLWDTFRRLAFSFNRLGHLPEPAHVGGLTLKLRHLAESLRTVTQYHSYFVFRKGIDPVERLRNPMVNVLSIAKEVEMLIQVGS